jgi:hypothetical protein
MKSKFHAMSLLKTLKNKKFFACNFPTNIMPACWEAIGLSMFNNRQHFKSLGYNITRDSSNNIQCKVIEPKYFE